MKSNSRIDIYSRVTAKIIGDLERGTRPWQKPWDVKGKGAGRITRPLRHSGTPYRGVNVLLLWCEAVEKGYRAPTWMTYKQALGLGGRVRHGEHGSTVVYTDRLTRTEIDDKGEEAERQIPYLKAYTVFNVEQIEGLPEGFQAPTGEAKGEGAAAETGPAKRFFAGTGAIIKHGAPRACYTPTAGFIEMPLRTSFRDSESYYATLAHETTHWTSHPDRLARTLGRRFGDEAYAAEELIAELGAAFLCADLGITPEVREDHASYLAHWLVVLKADSRAIFTAASHAERAVAFLHALQVGNKN